LFDESHDQPSVAGHSGNDGEAVASEMAHHLWTGTTQGAVGLTPPDFGVGEGVVAVIVIDELSVHAEVYHL
jgi:hypothetical protein